MGLFGGLLGGIGLPGLGGGGSSQDSFSSGGIANKESTTVQQTTNTYSDNRSVWDMGGGIVGNGNSQTAITTVVDGGAIAAVRDMGLAQTRAAVDIAAIGSHNAEAAMATGLAAQSAAIRSNTDTTRAALDLVGSSAQQSYTSSRAALGFASDSFDKLVGASQSLVKSATDQAQNAADQSNGNRTLILAIVGLLGVVGAAMFFAKRGH